MSRKIANRFFKEHQLMLDNFMRDFDVAFEKFDIDPHRRPFRLLSHKPLTSFLSDDFFQAIEPHETEEERAIKQQFKLEYLDLKKKYEQQLLNLEQKSIKQTQEKEKEMEMEIEPKSNDYTYDYQCFREYKDGKETGKIVEQKQKLVEGKIVKEKKSTIINQDGTKDIEIEIEDEKGKKIQKKKLDKDDKPLAIAQ